MNQETAETVCAADAGGAETSAQLRKKLEKNDTTTFCSQGLFEQSDKTSNTDQFQAVYLWSCSSFPAQESFMFIALHCFEV